MLRTNRGSDASNASNPEASRTFDFSGKRLTVLSDYAKVDVREGGSGAVSVDRHVTAIGKNPRDPSWSLEGDVLDLGTVCDDGFVGVCEVTYAVTVPDGVQVDVKE